MNESRIFDAHAGEHSYKVIGYYPCWEPDALDQVNFSVLTHVNFAFVIPTAEGTLLPLRNPQVARKLIAIAHENGTKAMIVVGGWDYQDVLLEDTFVKATDTPEKIRNLADEIINLCNEYGFDGVDIDWEYPRLDNGSYRQYETLMLYLSRRLHAEGKLLTAAVMSGMTPDGTVFYDAPAQTDAVLAACDWINVMAYDGGEAEKHSTYEFAVSCGNYWKNERNLPAAKVILGVPFYARTENGAYKRILEADADAYQRDTALVNGKMAYYNGIPTIQKKAAFAKENLGGIMIWELTQDTMEKEKSLLMAIGRIAS